MKNIFKNKKVIIPAGVILVIVLIIISWLTGLTGKKEEGVQIAKPTQAPVSKTISEEEIPQIVIDVNPDRSGATLEISNIAERFSELEYELIYTAESNEGMPVERGVAGGPIAIASSRKVSETVLFGTESCTTGTCRRHIDKNVSSGTLVLRLVDQEGSAWEHQVNFTIEKTTKGYEAIIE